jgi:ribosomal-protein-alanine N-acetyltransferase
MLLHYAMGEARHMGAKSLLLEVNVNNTAAQTLYEAQGFEKFSIRKEYYSNADGTKADAICMRKGL